jgi:hypothetical protein
MSKHTDYPHYDQDGYSTWDSDSDITTFFNKAGQQVEDPNKRGKSFLSGYMGRFKDNMADYFENTKKPFDFTQMAEPGKISQGEGKEYAAFQPFPNFAIDHGPQKGAIIAEGTKGSPGFLSQIAGPIAGAAASAFFCDMRLKHDVDCLTDMNLVKDDLADVAYFVKELQDS